MKKIVPVLAFILSSLLCTGHPSVSGDPQTVIHFAPYSGSSIMTADTRETIAEVSSSEFDEFHEDVQVSFNGSAVNIVLFLINDDPDADADRYETVLSFTFDLIESDFSTFTDDSGEVVTFKIEDDETAVYFSKTTECVIMVNKVDNTAYGMSYIEDVFSAILDIERPKDYNACFDLCLETIQDIRQGQLL